MPQLYTSFTSRSHWGKTPPIALSSKLYRAMRYLHLLAISGLFFLQDTTASTGDLIGQPMIGAVTDHSAQLLVLTDQYEPLHVAYWAEGTTDTLHAVLTPSATDTLRRRIIYYYAQRLDGLRARTTYEVRVGSTPPSAVRFTTAPIPGQAADFAFQIGSCAAPFTGWFFPFNRANRIFDRMTAQPADFMVWMGDNVYYMLNEWNSTQKMVRKNLEYRTHPKISRFLNSRPQWATWDDHDFGPNDAESQFHNKDEALRLFQQFWRNDQWGLPHAPGVFGQFSYGDADFFLLDSRYYRADSTSMLGKAQLEWLKISLLQSQATFKFIVSGTQLLPHMKAEDFGDYPQEKADFLAFLRDNDIKGVVLLSGDTHYAELSKLDRPGTYPLYEMTASALTSPYFAGSSKGQTLRMAGTLYTARNFGVIALSGEGDSRTCTLRLMDAQGQQVWHLPIKASSLR